MDLCHHLSSGLRDLESWGHPGLQSWDLSEEDRLGHLFPGRGPLGHPGRRSSLLLP